MPKMPTIDYFRKLEQRFWSTIKKNDKCWEWQGRRDRRNYGTLRVSNKQMLAHRVSWQLNVGRIPTRKLVCHSCDNPPCVRPSHLWIGTNKQNMDDAKSKGLFKLGAIKRERNRLSKQREL